MSSSSPELSQAVAWHQQGRIDEAEVVYRRLLATNPDWAYVRQLLGLICHQRRDFGEAAAAIEEAVRLQPGIAEYHNNLGEVYRALGRVADAVKCYRRALELNPAYADAHYNLGLTLLDAQEPEAAEGHFRLAVKEKPSAPEMHNALGLCARALGRFDEALAHFDRAIEWRKDYAEAYRNRALTHQARGDNSAALLEYQRLLQLFPDHELALINLGNLLRDVGRISAAEEAIRRALAVNPASPWAQLTQANLLLAKGQAEEAVETFDKLRGTPMDLPEVGSYLLYAATCASSLPSVDVADRHREWAERFARQVPRFEPKARARDGSRLRIGFVSGDFSEHAVMRFLMPVLQRADRNKLEFFCYSNSGVTDAVTQKTQIVAEHWRTILGWSDQRAGEQIIADGIDILIDLAGHTAKNRLLLFARKPAPLQVSYLGYPNTTGLSTIDYRIVDRWSDPEGLTDPHYPEKLWRLPETAWCYRRPENLPEVTASPRLPKGEFAFGSFNNLAKLSRRTIELWSAVLRAVPHATLILKARVLAEDAVRDEVVARFEHAGVGHRRLQFAPWTPTSREHFEYYRRVDLALDTFPYHGTNTTCDALIMGVPVLTLAGETHCSRVGVSLLTNVGWPQWVAKSDEDFVRRAVELAGAPEKLAEIRATLRPRMEASPLMDESRFVRYFEDALEAMWRRHGGERSAVD